jgi:hypothetical protein
MGNAEALAWSRAVFDEVGPYVRRRLPQILLEIHARYVATQVALDLDSNDAYGLIWLGLPKALVEDFEGVAGVQMHRPRWGRYRLPVINGVPVIPWRYAKDSTTDVDLVPFGRPVSAPRRAMFGDLALQAELPLGEAGLGDEVIAELPVQDRQEVDAYIAGIKELMQSSSVTAVLAYASTPDGVHRCHFGYATLRDDDTLDWQFREEVELSAVGRGGLKLVHGAAQRPTFDSGEPVAPALRPRSPFEGEPTGAGEPPVKPEKTGEDE